MRKIEKHKQQLNLRAKRSLHAALQETSWEEKLAAIQRMNEAAKTARQAMRQARAAARKKISK